MSKRTCKVDQVEYKYCPNCPSGANQPSWMMTFCCENCKNIFETLVNPSVGKLPKPEARRELRKFDLSNKENYTASVRKHVEEILSRRQVIEEISEE